MLNNDCKTLVVIPVFNADQYIKVSIESCLYQSSSTEVWVIDNCSTDQTQKIVKSYEDKYNNVKLIINDKNYGRIGNFNICLDIFMNGKYDYLKILFSGDELAKDSIRIVEDIFTKHPGLSMVNGLYVFNDGLNKRVVGKKTEKSCRVSKNELIKEGLYPSSATGTLNSVTYSKKGIGDYRLNSLFLGIAMFHNNILLNNGDIYYTNNVVGIFNLDAHNSFELQFNYLYRYEYAFSKLSGLNAAKDLFLQSEFEKVELNTATQLLVECIRIGKWKLVVNVLLEISSEIKKKVKSKFMLIFKRIHF